MKSRFTTLDILAFLAEMNQKFIGMRVNQIYDVDHKTYLIKLQRSEERAVLLFESGIRIHTTDFQWPKNPAPSGFSMKLRKHLNNKRLENVQQVGSDRIIDLQFGSNEAAYHVIIELYDRGNIALTDYNYTILYILRPRTEGDDVKFAVKEKYPIESKMCQSSLPSIEAIREWINSSKNGESLKKILTPKTEFGPALIEHVLLEAGFPQNTRVGKEFDAENHMGQLYKALLNANSIMKTIGTTPKGFIIQKVEKRPTATGSTEDFYTNQEFHPCHFLQHSKLPFKEFPSFNQAVDEFFSNLESQKLDIKAVQQEKEALKKLDNIRQDHEKRLANLHRVQEEDEKKARLIEINQPLVDHAIQVIRSGLANQITWEGIEKLVDEAKKRGDPVAQIIKKLKLNINHITLILSDPFADEDDEGSLKPMLVDVDLDLTAYANARKYFDEKRNASKKEAKTLESSEKAFKSAEKKAKQTLKESATIATIRKARKVLWFEKFYWFISSDNYLVVGGRDRQQNELLVKRYLKTGDLYVHADLHGASSVIIKNPANGPVAPRTLQEAGLMAVCYSAAWDAKVVTTSWWVYNTQVSKTAPTGEYLTTGSFMIRGKKNFLTPLPLVLGFGLLFRLEENSVFRHLDDRKPKAIEEESEQETDQTSTKDIDIDTDDSPSNSDDDEQADYAKSIENARSLLAASRLSEEPSFPDTVVDIGANLKSRTMSTVSTISEEESYTIIGDAPTAVANTSYATKAERTKKSEAEKTKVDGEIEESNKPSFKRGQKGKLKKIKEKYKDQDEEERQLRMQILQSAGAPKEKGKNSKKKAMETKAKSVKTNKPIPKNDLAKGVSKKANDEVTEGVTKSDEVQQENENKTEILIEEQQEEVTEEIDQLGSSDIDLLNSLTGIPVIEDELLYAVPVVAPYSALSQYKYKVKVIPGQTKRGKAAKTALSSFSADKSGTNREKDLIKSLKDQDVGRNLPGKVKLAMPQSQKHKK